jgi:glutamate N-acetyltransferase/amino-acid N-acetyltransferase
MLPTPKSFRFAATAAGFKKEGRLDLGMIVSDTPATAAGVFTTNRFQAAPVLQAMEMLRDDGAGRAFLANSGQANACTGEKGLIDCQVMLELAGKAVELDPAMILPASTGVIGQRVKLDRFKAALPALAESLGTAGPLDFAKSIMTTDDFPKLAWGDVETPSGRARILGIAKGAGMIAPDMATMLGFIATDAAIEPESLHQALTEAVEGSFNRITVDGDTSTNDCVMVLANGASGVEIGPGERDEFTVALLEVCRALAYMIVEDAEGGTKVIRIRVTGARTREEAKACARAVGNSPLVKTAMFGEDANWGRIVGAVGRSGALLDPAQVRIAIGGITLFAAGEPVDGDMDSLLAPIMKRSDIAIDVDLAAGQERYEVFASDLTHEYVSINADYRS